MTNIRERVKQATNAHCENMRPGSNVAYTSEFKEAWECRVSFEIGADFVLKEVEPLIEALRDIVREQQAALEHYNKYSTIMEGCYVVARRTLIATTARLQELEIIDDTCCPCGSPTGDSCSVTGCPLYKVPVE